MIAILDSRINTKKYGQRIVASLPSARRSLQFSAVQAFFADVSPMSTTEFCVSSD